MSLNYWKEQSKRRVINYGFREEIYRALEDVVGPENISEEPAILDSYAWCGLYATGSRNHDTPEEEKKKSFMVSICTIGPKLYFFQETQRRSRQ